MCASSPEVDDQTKTSFNSLSQDSQGTQAGHALLSLLRVQKVCLFLQQSTCLLVGQENGTLALQTSRAWVSLWRSSPGACLPMPLITRLGKLPVEEECTASVVRSVYTLFSYTKDSLRGFVIKYNSFYFKYYFCIELSQQGSFKISLYLLNISLALFSVGDINSKWSQVENKVVQFQKRKVTAESNTFGEVTTLFSIVHQKDRIPVQTWFVTAPREKCLLELVPLFF